MAETTTKKPRAAKAASAEPKGRYIYAVGRRKTATARVRLYEGSGNVVVNGKAMKDYFGYTTWQKYVTQPLVIVGAEKDVDIMATVLGGGLHAQADAIAHGVSRALVIKDEGYKKVLKGSGLLTRDPRMKERKKPGLKRARRAPQWSKR